MIITNKIVKIGIASFLAIVIASLAGVFYSPIVSAEASAQDAVCDTLKTTGQSDCDSGGSRVNDAIRIAINMLSIAAGVASIIMLILGGFKYITSTGDSNSLTSAKNTILYAIIGLVIVAFSQVIVRFVINTSENATTPTPVNQKVNPDII